VAFDVITLCVAALMILLCFLSLREILRAILSTRWPETVGTVVESRWRCLGGMPKISGYWMPIVKYRYFVEGRELKGDRIAFWGSLWFFGFTENQAQYWSARWVAGDPATIRHNPKRPEVAVLVAGLNWYVAADFLVSAIGAGGFLYLAWSVIFP
jgi:hypothetical protein